MDEACSFWKISPNTCYAWIKAGRLRAGRTGANASPQSQRECGWRARRRA
ncbi:hypothetical protein PSTG_18325 [Puccinia striiformis f. sp. tritici PST-78]|uniref:Helix-turn-helix domain-containing protein n=1 Tax=Puccinia striiformis f. sp. tritici PST-78 TaxID=1165861 RepID=A0A0L0UNC2_9BASI|nr:hypothetical protein PSTG_18325 [Puccinia striiformis f. sp. tritici PST-78]